MKDFDSKENFNAIIEASNHVFAHQTISGIGPSGLRFLKDDIQKTYDVYKKFETDPSSKSLKDYKDVLAQLQSDRKNAFRRVIQLLNNQNFDSPKFDPPKMKM